GRGQMACHGEMHDGATVVRQQDEYKQQATGRRRNDEEIGGHELFHVIGERATNLRGRRDPAPEALAIVACENCTPSLSKSPWIRGAPESGLSGAIRRISACISWPTIVAPCVGGSSRSRTTGIPGDAGRRPSQASQPRPQPAVRFGKPNPRRPKPLQHEQLMTQRENFKVESRSGSNGSGEHHQNRNQAGCHREESLAGLSKPWWLRSWWESSAKSRTDP